MLVIEKEKASYTVNPATKEEMEKIIGGPVEMVHPFPDDPETTVARIARKEGKEMNRAIYNDNYSIKEVICGTFGILSDDENKLKKYAEMFATPEKFFIQGSNLVSIPAPVNANERKEGLTMSNNTANTATPAPVNNNAPVSALEKLTAQKALENTAPAGTLATPALPIIPGVAPVAPATPAIVKDTPAPAPAENTPAPIAHITPVLPAMVDGKYPTHPAEMSANAWKRATYNAYMALVNVMGKYGQYSFTPSTLLARDEFKDIFVDSGIPCNENTIFLLLLHLCREKKDSVKLNSISSFRNFFYSSTGYGAYYTERGLDYTEPKAPAPVKERQKKSPAPAMTTAEQIQALVNLFNGLNKESMNEEELKALEGLKTATATILC